MNVLADFIKVLKRESSDAVSHLSVNSKEEEKSRKLTYEQQEEEEESYQSPPDEEGMPEVKEEREDEEGSHEVSEEIMSAVMEKLAKLEELRQQRDELWDINRQLSS